MCAVLQGMVPDFSGGRKWEGGEDKCRIVYGFLFIVYGSFNLILQNSEEDAVVKTINYKPKTINSNYLSRLVSISWMEGLFL